MSSNLRVEFPDNEDLRNAIWLALVDLGVNVTESKMREEMKRAYDMYGMSVLVDPEQYCEERWFNLSAGWSNG
jgi:hypothetical protein